MKTLRTSLILSASFFALTACGPGAKVGSKQASAEALHALSKPTNSAATRAASPIDTTDIDATCAQGGTSKLSNFTNSIDNSGGSLKVVQSFTMTLTGCGLAKTELGAALYSGTVQVSQIVSTDASGVNVEQTFKGKVTLDGAVSDFLDCNISQKVAVGAASSQSQGSVAEVLKGTLTTSSGTYTFDESVTVQDGAISISAK